MMNNNLNKKRERDDKGIVITLGKMASGYYYHSDSLTERYKIKIPITELTNQENFNFGSGHSQDNFEKKKEKSERGSSKHASGNVGQNTLNELKTENAEASSTNWNNLVNNNNQSAIQPQVNANVNHEEFPQIAKLIDKAQKQNIIVPSCSSWFKFDEIHEIETRSLPEYFCGKYPSKNPETYRESRNFIINLYRENPNSYLTSTGNKII
jgi:hypothetical protein